MHTTSEDETANLLKIRVAQKAISLKMYSLCKDIIYRGIKNQPYTYKHTHNICKKPSQEYTSSGTSQKEVAKCNPKFA